MSFSKLFSGAFLTAAAAIWVTGCPSSGPPGPVSNPPPAAEHDHAHEHVHGPNGGHVIELGEEEYHAEWTHDEDGKVTIYLLDKEVKNPVPIAAESITIETKIGDKPPATFTLAAMDRSEGDMPKASKFEVVDKNLLGVLESLSEGVTATLKVTINDKPYEGKFTHDDHGHKH